MISQVANFWTPAENKFVWLTVQLSVVWRNLYGIGQYCTVNLIVILIIYKYEYLLSTSTWNES